MYFLIYFLYSLNFFPNLLIRFVKVLLLKYSDIAWHIFCQSHCLIDLNLNPPSHYQSYQNVKFHLYLLTILPFLLLDFLHIMHLHIDVLYHLNITSENSYVSLKNPLLHILICHLNYHNNYNLFKLGIPVL